MATITTNDVRQLFDTFISVKKRNKNWTKPLFGKNNTSRAIFNHIRLFAILPLAICTVICMVIPNNVVAQNRIIDSLKERLSHSAISDTSRVVLLNTLAKQYWTIDPAASLRYAEQAQGIALQSEYSKGEATSYNNQGVAWWYRGDYKKAFELHRKALVLRQKIKDEDGVSSSLNNLGTISFQQGDYHLALEYFLQALSIAERKNDQSRKAVFLNNIGELYHRQQELTKAQEYFEQSLALYRALGDSISVANSINNLGELEIRKGNYDRAFELFHRALQMLELSGNKQQKALLLSNIASVYFARPHYEKALGLHREALALRRDIEDRQGEAISDLQIAQVFIRLRQFDSAGRYIDRGQSIATEIGARDIVIQAYLQQSRLDSLQGNYASALQYHHRAITLKDSIFSAEKTRQLAALQYHYDSEKREQELKQHNRERIMQRNAWMAAFLILALTSAIIATGYMTNRRQNIELTAANKEVLRQKTILEEQAGEIELKNGELQQANFQLEEAFREVHELNARFVEKNYNLELLNQEMERQQRLLEDQAVEIELVNNALQEKNSQLEMLNSEKSELLGIAAHDLKNPIAGIIMASSTIQRYYEQMTDEDIFGSAQNIEETARAMNAIIMNVLDTNVIESGRLSIQWEEFDGVMLMKNLLEQYAERAQTKDLTIHLQAQPSSLRLYADERLTAQVIDNLLSNAVKYSPMGKNIWVTLKEWNMEGTPHITVQDLPQHSSQTMAHILIKDEGPGIQADEMPRLFGKFARLSARPTGGEHSTGLGLSIVKKLVEAMHGIVWCESVPGEGASFSLLLPVVSAIPYSQNGNL